ncbi:DUF6786 family protein [Chryseolinea sp. T2]|uniref:DUF6786 family protein n=1 Tax=Chryseolinea sp. T2 TaxID=3129255 RepID=UPI00307748E0
MPRLKGALSIVCTTRIGIKRIAYAGVIATSLLISCRNKQPEQSTPSTDTVTTKTYIPGSYGYDLQELRGYHPDLVELSDRNGKAKIIILPGYQARVMTSTASGDIGQSFGWVNHKLIASGDSMPHMHAFGGEERFWLGPEGGQFSIYFRQGVPFTYDNWQVPKEIDTERFSLVNASPSEAKFEKDMHFENYSGNALELRVNRNIRLLSPGALDSLLGVSVPESIEKVGFETENIITNTGQGAWTKKTGMLSVWILSMMNASDNTTVVIPYADGNEKQLGKIVTDDYFGKVPSDRLAVGNGLILFKADGNYRSKIGVSPKRAKPFVGSYDAVNGVLTIAMFTLHQDGEYVNSKWEVQKDPFTGDAINSYNDGPVNGTQMGKLYEIESSSPAAALKAGESLTHFHRTIHLKGDKAELSRISEKLLGAPIDRITGGLAR